jgi:hypothetical protein
MASIPKTARAEISTKTQEQIDQEIRGRQDRSAYLRYCSDIEPMVRLTLLGSDVEIMTRCLAKAQAKRVAREHMIRFCGRFNTLEMCKDMNKPPLDCDRELAGGMFDQALRWRSAIRAALDGPDDVRIRRIAMGEAPILARAMTGSSWFAHRSGIKTGVLRHLESIPEVRDDRGERMRQAPSDAEDAFAASRLA